MRIITRRQTAAVLLGATLLWSSAGWSNEAVNWLNQMQQAVRYLDYSGKLVYSQGKELSTFRIDHNRSNGKGNENVTLLTTQGGGSAVKAFSLVNFNRLKPQAQAYRYDLGGRENVAGRDCQVVVVRPKDKMRYLHRYCIDAESRLLLKYSLMNRQQDVLEQLLFTEVALQEKALQPTAVAAKPVSEKRVQNVAELSAPTTSKWRFETLPRGFQHTKSMLSPPGKSTDHLIVSDGMTAVSVFITPRSDRDNYHEIKYSKGAVNILTQDFDAFLVTLVGEVPDSTLRAIHKGLRHAQ